jgi:hypothetical protein
MAATFHQNHFDDIRDECLSDCGQFRNCQIAAPIQHKTVAGFSHSFAPIVPYWYDNSPLLSPKIHSPEDR